MPLKQLVVAQAASRIGLLIFLALAACASPGPAATLPPVAPVTILNSATASPVPATATQAPTATRTSPPAPTLTPKPTPVPASATATVPPIVRFMAVGDLMLGRGVGKRIQALGPGVVFSGVSTTLAQADLLAANLECVISDQGQPQPKGYTFQAPLAAISSLTTTGFDVLSVANNHSMDYGTEGLADMLARLRNAGLSFVGAGANAADARAPVVLARNGVRVAFLAYVNVPVEGRTGFDTRRWAADAAKPGVAWAEPEVIAKDVASAKALADVVVVLLHVGLEGRIEVNSIQRSLAHAAVDAGAGLVIGSHSHTLQPVERYGDGIIAYSLGNFVFDGFAGPSNYTAIFTATLTPRGVESYQWVPVVVENGLPRLATKDEAAVILPLVREE